ncbi:MaoC/PaaZ C-terminal domain-containing protein [Salinisphaera sp. LB1]|uniref:MaoC/PaaZ C-terminal domain-containing protein n=1 Tax=Salinisphaera sp. LB1 TaxID=2183911 RepID=UPI000D708973|nr:MaoC/PaaZ C-terminal domain-containing protein [Salinisphaera sp. LB1]AWN17767.1 Acyl dehydratase [Salinisphaera sp. LB1]
MIGFDDLEAGRSFTLGPTGASRDDMIAFARAYDPQPFHLSDEAASRTYFKRLSASGWHTGALMLALVTANPDWPLACRGCQEIRDLRWRAPVYPDDRLSAAVTVIERRLPENGGPGTVTLDLQLSNQHAVTVAGMTVVLAVARRIG